LAASYIVVSEKLADKCKKQAQKAVGKSRAGWAKAAQDCKADTRAQEKLSGIPSWVKRHMATSGGNAVEMDKSFFGGGTAGNFRVILRSGVPYASSLLSRQVIADKANIARGRMAKFFKSAIRAELKKVQIT